MAGSFAFSFGGKFFKTLLEDTRQDVTLVCMAVKLGKSFESIAVGGEDDVSFM